MPGTPALSPFLALPPCMGPPRPGLPVPRAVCGVGGSPRSRAVSWGAWEQEACDSWGHPEGTSLWLQPEGQRVVLILQLRKLGHREARVSPRATQLLGRAGSDSGAWSFRLSALLGAQPHPCGTVSPRGEMRPLAVS